MRGTTRPLSSQWRTALLVSIVLASVASIMFGASASAHSHDSSVTPQYYLSLGDSFAQGFQPGFQGDAETDNGFSDKLVGLLAQNGTTMTLENFGCGRATTNSMLTTLGCPHLAANATQYPGLTQVQAVVAFIEGHPNQIGLITIAIGFNDFNRCKDFLRGCVRSALANSHMMKNLEAISLQLRAAAGSTVPILAITYPDMFLGEWLTAGHARNVALRSVVMFKEVINAAYEKGYRASHVIVVDITSDTNAYQPISSLTTLAPYGVIPLSVATECTLTWYCLKHDVHPRDAGYLSIAQLLYHRYYELVG